MVEISYQEIIDAFSFSADPAAGLAQSLRNYWISINGVPKTREKKIAMENYVSGELAHTEALLRYTREPRPTSC